MFQIYRKCLPARLHTPQLCTLWPLPMRQATQRPPPSRPPQRQALTNNPSPVHQADLIDRIIANAKRDARSRLRFQVPLT